MRGTLINTCFASNINSNLTIFCDFSVIRALEGIFFEEVAENVYFVPES